MKLICFSLYGDNPKYCVGAIENLQLQPSIYPGWTCRVYHDDSVPKYCLDGLTRLGAELIDMSGTEFVGHGMFWRFLAYDDKQVSRFIVRDADSRLSIREKAAVEDWIQSGKKLHVIRDHPQHGAKILGGTWGLRNDYKANMRELILAYNHGKLCSVWYDDQLFLRTIYRLYRRDVIGHDDFFQYIGNRPFPVPRSGSEFVGRVFDEFNVPCPDGDRSLKDGLAQRASESRAFRVKRTLSCWWDSWKK